MLKIIACLLVLQSLALAAPAAGDTTRKSDAAERGRRSANEDPHDATRGTHDATDGDDDDDLELAGAKLPVHGPAIGAVLAAAYASAGLDHDPGRSWVARTRLAGLIPWVTVRTARDTSWQDQESEVGHSTSLELRATWRLDRLLFDSRELQVSTIELARRRARQRLATRVIRSYFTWRRAAGVAAARASGGEDRMPARLAEAIAELDAFTDGWFSEELAHDARAASAPDSRAARANR